MTRSRSLGWWFRSIGGARAAGASLVATLALVATPACAPSVAASAGFDVAAAGANAFIDGDLDATYAVPIEDALRATTEAMAELGFTKVKTTSGPMVARVRTMDDAGRGITIALQRRSPTVTKLRISIGLVGDQTFSRLILGTIQARLPAQPTAAPHTPGGVEP
jgi:hypothetical protein